MKPHRRPQVDADATATTAVAPKLSHMRARLLADVRRRGGVISRTDALTVAPAHVLDKAVAAGVLTRPFARTYVLSSNQPDALLRRRAALASIPGSFLSHTDALAVVSALPGPDLGGPVHLSVPAGGRHPRPQPGLVVHRRRRSAFVGALDLRGVGPMVSLRQALVDSWSLLANDARRATVIDAVRERRVRVDDVRAVLDEWPHVAGTSELRELLALLGAGCQSELEIWGLTHVFEHASLPPSTSQYAVVLPGRTAILDRAYVRERVGVELDGAAYHFSPAQRERDMRRDEALTAAGWVVLRFSWRRLHQDPGGVRQRILALLGTRRSQLGQGDVAVLPPGEGHFGG